VLQSAAGTKSRHACRIAAREVGERGEFVPYIVRQPVDEFADDGLHSSSPLVACGRPELFADEQLDQCQQRGVGAPPGLSGLIEVVWCLTPPTRVA
jgi:hypothetical protein